MRHWALWQIYLGLTAYSITWGREITLLSLLDEN